MKLSEFSRLTGFKRTTLQLYDRKGILKPVSRSEAGYWEYDMNSAGRAFMIAILKEAGYTLDEIKQMLSENEDIQKDWNEIMDACEERLTLKIQKINGYIQYLQDVRTSFANSANFKYLTELIFEKVDLAEAVGKIGGLKNEIDQSGSRNIRKEEVIAETGSGTPDPEATKELYNFVQPLYCLSFLKGKEPPEGPTVQATLLRIYTHVHSHPVTNINTESVNSFALSTRELFHNCPEKALDLIEQIYGNGSIDYILQALDVFGQAEHST